MRTIAFLLFMLLFTNFIPSQVKSPRFDEVRYYRDFNLLTLEFSDEIEGPPNEGPCFVKLMKCNILKEVVAHFPGVAPVGYYFDDWKASNIALHRKTMGLVEYQDLSFYLGDSLVAITLMKDGYVKCSRWRMSSCRIETEHKYVEIRFENYSTMPPRPARWIRRKPMKFLATQIDTASNNYTITQKWFQDREGYLEMQYQHRENGSNRIGDRELDDSLSLGSICIQKDSAWWKPHFILWENWSFGVFPRCEGGVGDK